MKQYYTPLLIVIIFTCYGIKSDAQVNFTDLSTSNKTVSNKSLDLFNASTAFIFGDYRQDDIITTNDTSLLILRITNNGSTYDSLIINMTELSNDPEALSLEAFDITVINDNQAFIALQFWISDGSWLTPHARYLFISDFNNGVWENKTQNFKDMSGAPFTPERIMRTSFTSPTTGYVLDIGRVYKTTDGGENINMVLNTYTSPIINMEVFNEDIILAGGNDGSFGYYGMIQTSVDGGQNWTEFIMPESYSSIFLLDMATSEIGYAYSPQGPSLYKTTDQGTTWTFMSSNNLPNIQPNGIVFFADMEFINEDLGFLTADTRLFKTEDGGENWMEISNFDQWLSSIDYFEDKLYICGMYGTIARSHDVGIPVGIENINQSDAVGIYPNPAKQDFTIDLGERYSNIKIKITDITGRVISFKQYESIKQLPITVHNYSGIALVSVETEAISKVIKVVLR